MWQLNNYLINMQTNTFACICIIFAIACKKKKDQGRKIQANIPQSKCQCNTLKFNISCYTGTCYK